MGAGYPDVNGVLMKNKNWGRVAVSVDGTRAIAGELTKNAWRTTMSVADYTCPFRSPPTAAEIQAVVDAVNGVGAVVEDIAGNSDGVAATASEINVIVGVSGAADGTDYSAGLFQGTFADSGRPTAAEIQVVIDSVNGQGVVAEDIAGNSDAVAASAAQIEESAEVVGLGKGASVSTVWCVAIPDGTRAPALGTTCLRPISVPASSHKVYTHAGWQGWGHWLRNGDIQGVGWQTVSCNVNMRACAWRHRRAWRPAQKRVRNQPPNNRCWGR